MQKFLLAILTFTFSSVVWAQTVVEALDKQLSSTRTFQAHFLQSTKSAQFGNQITEGEMKLERPGKFVWQVTEPDKQLLVSNGQKLWIYDEDLEQVMVQKLSQRLDETPALLLAGKVESIQEFFVVSELKSKQAGTWYELRARDQEGMVDKVILNFVDNVIHEMQLHDNLGQRTDILFSKIKTNITFPKDTFTFYPPKGVEVIDEN